MCDYYDRKNNSKAQREESRGKSQGECRQTASVSRTPERCLSKKLVRGYVTPEAKACYDEIREKTDWTDSEAMSNAMRLMYAAYKCGQIKLLNEWLRKNNR